MAKLQEETNFGQPRKTRREREHERKRKEIIDAAEDLFFSKGYENATINEIAEAAEFAKGTIYLYFSGKSEIYLAIVSKSMDLLSDMLKGKIGEGQSGAEQLKAGNDVFTRFFNQHPRYFDMWLRSVYYVEADVFMESRSGKECREKEGQFMEMTSGAIRKGLKDGSIKNKERPEILALAVTVFNRGLYQFLLDDQGRALSEYGADREQFIGFMKDLFYKGLQAKTSDR